MLQGYGVTVQLHGETFIFIAAITSTTFKTVPDVPLGTFALNLPEGNYSALAANGDLCRPISDRSKLKMGTAFVAQRHPGPIQPPQQPNAALGRGQDQAALGTRTAQPRRTGPTP